MQETQSPPVSSLPVDQPFRHDGPVGSHGREVGFLFGDARLGPIRLMPMGPFSALREVGLCCIRT